MSSSPNIYNGTYTIQAHEPMPATFVFQAGKLVIRVKDEYGEDRGIYWPYEKIVRETFWKEGRAVVRLSGYPSQVIETSSRYFVDELENHLYRKEASWYKRTTRQNWMGLFKVLLVFLGLLVAAYLWLVPFIADRMARKVPISYEESLGNSVFNAIKGSFKIDQAKTAVINDFFHQLRIETPYNVRITVVDDNVVNAFALPGGNIVVYDKIIDELGSYEDLAALLSHEFTHVSNKHTTRRIFRQLGSAIFFSVILGDMGSITGTVVSNADNLKTLNYSRSLEKEADLDGLKILSERKIDGNGFVRLFEVLKKEEAAAGGNVPEWSNSHPNLDKRIKYIKDSEYFNNNGVVQDSTLATLFKKVKSEW